MVGMFILTYAVGFVLSMLFFGAKVKPESTLLFVFFTVIWPVSMTLVLIHYILLMFGRIHRGIYRATHPNGFRDGGSV